MDEVVWTEDGVKALAADAARFTTPLRRTVNREALLKDLDSIHRRFLPAWQRGLERADQNGRAAVAFLAENWTPAGFSRAMTVDEAAGAGSLLGARGSGGEEFDAFPELVLRDHGWHFALQVLARMWSQETNYKDPDWPSSEARLAVWLTAIADDDRSVYDASVSYGKAKFALYLQCVALAEKPEVQTALNAVWATAPIHARPALVAACADSARAATTLEAVPRHSGSFPTRSLAPLVRDPALLVSLIEGEQTRLDVTFIDRLGLAALPLYQRALQQRMGAPQRLALLVDLTNFRGPTAASLLAPFAEKAPYTQCVRQYFARAPELLAELLADTALPDDVRVRLEKLRKHVEPRAKKARPAKPATR